ncbi:hypothetical protein RKK42_31445 [Klebsiella pneumoniae]|nr:hypothetical protein [Klebsiella pneumoniae]
MPEGLSPASFWARLLAFLLLDGHFAAADEAVNAKLNQESRRSSQRTGEMTDVRHLHFGGSRVPVNALADFFHGAGPETAGGVSG